MYVATASPRPKRSAFDSSRGGMCPVFPPPLGSATARDQQCCCSSRQLYSRGECIVDLVQNVTLNWGGGGGGGGDFLWV